MVRVEHSNRELWAAFFAIIFITIIYLGVVLLLSGIPPASDIFGHALGIFGFILMLMTEILYSIRKRRRTARWGRLSSWLRFHIFTGLVGPYMVLLHSSWKFNGEAGLTMLLTIVIVASGFVGRYIYTSIPHTPDGAELQTEELNQYIASLEADIQISKAIQSPTIEQSKELKRLYKRQRRLRRQIASLAAARRMFSVWHTLHIPIGVVLFTAAFIHIIATIYLVTLPRLLHN